MGSVAQDILDRSLRHKLGLAAWENDLVEQVIRLLNAVDADLERRITDAIDNSLHLDSVTRLRQIRQELRQVNREAYDAAHRHLSSELRAAAALTGTWQVATLTKVVPVLLSFSRPSANLLRSIATSRPFEGALLRDHVAKLAGNRLDAMIRALDIGLAEQDSLSGLLQRVRGTRRGRFQDGVLGKIGRNQLERFVRTAAQHVTETARDLTLQENADVLRGVMWVTTLDDRACKRCQRRDGLIWTIKAHRPVNHDVSWGGGPGRLHWLDRCTSVPVLKSLAQMRRAGVDLKGLTKGQRAAMGGPVPVTQTYGDWLRDQPFSVQRRVLGLKRARDFRDGLDLDAAWRRRYDVRATPAQKLAEVFPGLADALKGGV